MNIYNPIHADRLYKLNLKTPDEHAMAQVLVKLAIVEPGENWVDEKFRRKESLPWSPGWQLPAEWEEEVIHYGLMECRYTSTGKGCAPNKAERHKLRSMFLCGGKPEVDA